MGLKWRFQVWGGDYGELEVAILSFGGEYGGSEVAILSFGRWLR